MTGRLHDDLELRLGDLAAHLEFPPTPALAAAVRSRLAAGDAGAAEQHWMRWRLPLGVSDRLRSWQRPLLVAAAAVAALALLVLAVPPARTTVAHWLGIRGVEIVPVQTLPPLPSATLQPATGEPYPVPGEGLNLGISVTVTQAEARLGFTVLVPAVLGAPDAVWARDEDGGVASLVYLPRPGLPASTPSGVGLLVSEVRGAVETPLLRKFVGPDTRVVPVTVSGGQGYWISGLNEIGYTLPDGSNAVVSLRLAGPTLLFQRGDLSIRIEGAPSEAQALRIAASLSPPR